MYLEISALRWLPKGIFGFGAAWDANCCQLTSSPPLLFSLRHHSSSEEINVFAQGVYVSLCGPLLQLICDLAYHKGVENTLDRHGRALLTRLLAL